MTTKTETKQLEKPARFIARVSELQVVLVPPRRKVYEDGTSELIQGNIAQFQGHVYETRDAEQRDRMLRHPQFDDAFHVMEAAEEPVPEPTGELAEIARLTAHQDVDGLAALYEREEEGFSRPLVLETVRSTLLALEGPEDGAQDVSGGSDGG